MHLNRSCIKSIDFCIHANHSELAKMLAITLKLFSSYATPTFHRSNVWKYICELRNNPIFTFRGSSDIYYVYDVKLDFHESYSACFSQISSLCFLFITYVLLLSCWFFKELPHKPLTLGDQVHYCYTGVACEVAPDAACYRDIQNT